MSTTIDRGGFHAELDTERLNRFLINSENEKRIRAIIRKVLKDVQTKVSASARNSMGSDPRQAYRAVKYSVYKRILGGNVSILQKKRAGGRNLIEPPRKLKPFQRGGNRLPRSKRTEDLMSYSGSDRGFILRFLNSGTSQRQTRYGNRGSIVARNWFPSSAGAAMNAAAGEVARLIEAEIAKQFNA